MLARRRGQNACEEKEGDGDRSTDTYRETVCVRSSPAAVLLRQTVVRGGSVVVVVCRFYAGSCHRRTVECAVTHLCSIISPSFV